MNSRKRRPVYSIDERKQIRRALKKYRDEHGIGDSALHNRILEYLGDDTSEDRVPRKTLQRFLAGTHRTNDPLVDICKRFLLAVAPPPPENLVGEALARFLSSRETGLDELEGAYRASLRTIHANDPRLSPRQPYVSPDGETKVYSFPGLPIATGKFDKPWSSLTFESTEEGGFLHVTETLFDADDANDREAQTKASAALGNTGMLVPCGSHEYFVLVRSYLDARFYLVRKVTSDDGITLQGTMMLSANPVMPFDIAANLWQPGFEIEIASCDSGDESEP